MEEVWARAIQPPPWNAQARLSAADELWARHGAQATRCAAVAALMMFQEAAGGSAERPVEVHAPLPGPDVLEPLGGRGKALMRSAFEWMGAMALSEQAGIDDPDLERTLDALASEFRGHSVYAFHWWTFDAASQLYGADPGGIRGRLDAVTARLAEL